MIMELNEQLTSLAPSKKLRELGVKQESECYFLKDLDNKHIGWHLFRINEIIPLEEQEFYYYPHISAFSVAENDDALPFSIMYNGEKLNLKMVKYRLRYNYGYYNAHKMIVRRYSEKQSDAGALLRIWLIENKLIEV